MRIKGKDIAVYRASSETAQPQKIALSRDCDLAVQCDMQEFSSFLSGRAKRFRSGRYSWTLNIDALVADDDGNNGELLAALKNGTRLFVTMSLGAPDGSSHAVGGWALVSTWQETAPLSGMATYKVALQGDGELN